MSNVPAHRSPHAQLPLSNESLREELLTMAGFDKEKRVELLKKVIKSAEVALSATKQTAVTEHGRVTDVFEQPDHMAQAKAREQLIDLIGVTSKVSSDRQTGGNIVIQPPAWMQVTLGPAVKPVNVPQQVEVQVIDAQAVSTPDRVCSPSEDAANA